MPFEVFCNKVSEFARKSGTRAVFEHRDGRHIARAADGTRIIGNTSSRKVTVFWGSGHMASAVL